MRRPCRPSPTPSRRWSIVPRLPRERSAGCAIWPRRSDHMNEHKRSSKADIEDLIRARYSLIWITSPEETRVEEALRKLCVEREMRLEVWSITEGFKTIANGQGTRDVKDPMKAIDHVIRAEGRALFILRDFHPFLKEPAVVRRLRDAATELRKTKKSLIVMLHISEPTRRTPIS